MDLTQQLATLYNLPASDTSNSCPKVLDTRPKAQYLSQRLAHSVNIELHTLTSSCYLLPDKATPFVVVLPTEATYTVVLDETQHGLKLVNGATAVCLRGAASLESFLAAGGWKIANVLLDSPQLWAAAEELHVLERDLSDPQQLARRCLFAPCPLLASTIARIEAALAAQQHASTTLQQQQHGPGSSPGSSKQVLLHVLDVGCGSGRDLAWLASRQHLVRVAAAACQQPAAGSAVCTGPCQCDHSIGSSSSSNSSHVSRQLRYTEQPQQPEDYEQQQVVEVRWHVTGLDSWLGALERAHDLAAAMQLTARQVELVFSNICSNTGDIQLHRLPQKSRLHRASNASVVCAPDAAPQQQVAAEAPGEGSAEARAASEAGAAEHGFRTRKYDLILCVRFLERALLPRLRGMLNPGGFILYSTFVDGPGLRAFGRPSGPERLLRFGELASSFFGPEQGFIVVRDDVALTNDGREVCWFAAQLQNHL